MECKVAQEKIMKFIDQGLSDEELEAFMGHVDSCQECYEELQISYSLFWGLKMLDQDQVDSFHIQHALDEFMQDQREKIRKKHIVNRLLFWITVIVTVVVILFFAFQMIRWLNPGLLERMLAMRM